MPKTFIVFEHVYDWGELSDVNSALLMTLRHAYPAAEIHFIGSDLQVDAVASKIKRHSVKGIHFHSLWTRPPSHALSRFGRYRREARKFMHLRRVAKRYAATEILLSSFDEMAYNLLGWGCVGLAKANYSAIVHDVGFLRAHQGNSWKQRLLRVARSRIKQLRLITYGPFVDELINQQDWPDRWTTGWINMPYEYPEQADVRVLPGAGICFFFLGGSRQEKGFDRFCELADQHAARSDLGKPRFALLGKLAWKPPGFSDQTPVELLSEGKRIDRDQYTELACGAHYAVMPYNNDSYRRMASASLCDAVAYGIPIIATDTPSTRYYFEQFGNIGYLCESLEAMRDVVEKILRNRPQDEYLEQQRNLHKARRALLLQAQSPRMHEIFGSPEQVSHARISSY